MSEVSVKFNPETWRAMTRLTSLRGIGGWPLALRWAGWGDRPVWTGSCPCQPFSNAGKKKAKRDARHLWPDFKQLIAQCRPATVFGEQVASPLGRNWLSTLRSQMEALAYEVGAADLCAAGIGAPHIRQRLFWVAHTECRPPERHRYEIPGAQSSNQEREKERQRVWSDAGDGGTTGRLENSADTDRGSTYSRRHVEENQRGKAPGIERPGDAVGLGDTNQQGSQGRRLRSDESAGQCSPWERVSFIECADGKARPTQPEILPLADGLPGRVGRIRGYGNAIVPQLAQVFIESFMDVRE